MTRVTLYAGIQKREINTDAVSFSALKNHLTADFFIIEDTGSKLVFAKCTGHVSKGNRVLLEVTIQDSGLIHVLIGGTQVQLIHIGLRSTIEFAVTSVRLMCCILNNIVFCQGFPHSTDLDNNPNVVCETINEHPGCERLRSSACLKVIPLINTNKVSVCSKCKSTKRTAVKHKLSSAPLSVSPDTNPGIPALSQQENIPPASALTQIPAVNHHFPPNTILMPVNINSLNVNSSQQAKTKPKLETKPSVQSVLLSLRDIAPNLTDKQVDLLKSQIDISNVTKHGRRWDNEIIQVCLSLWTRSPNAYLQLASSGLLVLPSVRTLSSYKNSVHQEPGINHGQLKWMIMQAKHDNIPPEGYHGGLILDEMAIQEDIQIQRSNRTFVGFPDMGGEGNSVTGNHDSAEKLANHVLQFIFHGFTGFRFLVAHYPTTQATGPQLYSVFWDILDALRSYGFVVDYTCLDGASTNRNFIKMNFSGPPSDSNMAARDPYQDDHYVHFLPDPSHLFKKLRNNLLKSGKKKWHTRLLVQSNNIITWEPWVKAYEWDKQHGLAIHRKLTHEHLHPNQADKMRNHLAEEVLDGEMLHLMEMFAESGSVAKDMVAGPVCLLKRTSKLLNIFKDRRPIKDINDKRLHDLKDVLKWFMDWEESEEQHNLMSTETREDLRFLLSGFESLCTTSLKDVHHAIVPGYINSDIIENIFSQQRGLHHGANSNPNYLQYCYGTNSITIGQSVISNKSNSARRKSTCQTGSLPFSHLCKKLRMW